LIPLFEACNAETAHIQAAHEKIFKAMDANKDGVLTSEEIQAFMRGIRKSAAQREDEHKQQQEEEDD
jgi:Ca2+-binding EF-hand superfamily protein